MKIDGNNYALKNYLINTQTEINKALVDSSGDIETREKLEFGLSIILDIIKICDERKRY